MAELGRTDPSLALAVDAQVMEMNDEEKGMSPRPGGRHARRYRVKMGSR
jgi:hypothetical protein